MKTKTRQSVVRFSDEMESRLRANDHKGRYGWAGWKKSMLLKMLLAEVLELAEAIGAGDEKRIKTEAADVGNFSMMIHDWRSR